MNELVLTRTLPYLTFAMQWRLRGVSRWTRLVITRWRATASRMRIAAIVASSPRTLEAILMATAHANLVSLVLERVAVRVGTQADVDDTVDEGADDYFNPTDDLDDELGYADKRPVHFPLPLGVLTRLNQLRHIVVVSTSVANTKPWTEPWATLSVPQHRTVTESVPVQLGLANLHELADSCPWLETLWAAHLETDRDDGPVTDVWGPDASPLVVRRLRERCPRLRVMGVLSSAGPRSLAELRRRWPPNRAAPPDGWTSLAEIQDVYRTSILACFREPWPCLERVVVAVPAVSAAHASGRSAVLFFARRELRGERFEDDALGELTDVLDHAAAASSSFAGETLVIARAYAARRGPRSGGGVVELEAMRRIAALVERESEASGNAVRLVSVPDPDVDVRLALRSRLIRDTRVSTWAFDERETGRGSIAPVNEPRVESPSGAPRDWYAALASLDVREILLAEPMSEAPALEAGRGDAGSQEDHLGDEVDDDEIVV